MMDETYRKQILRLLERGEWTVRQISQELHISEREVEKHLSHVEKSTGSSTMVQPARCKKCSFLFSKRSRARKPSRCPSCRSEQIAPPVFGLSKNRP